MTTWQRARQADAGCWVKCLWTLLRLANLSFLPSAHRCHWEPMGKSKAQLTSQLVGPVILAAFWICPWQYLSSPAPTFYQIDQLEQIFLWSRRIKLSKKWVNKLHITWDGASHHVKEERRRLEMIQTPVVFKEFKSTVALGCSPWTFPSRVPKTRPQSSPCFKRVQERLSRNTSVVKGLRQPHLISCCSPREVQQQWNDFKPTSEGCRSS